MNKSIVPKLVSTMQQLIIDPRQQILDPWHWFIAWYDMVPLASMIVILEKNFFFPNGYKLPYFANIFGRDSTVVVDSSFTSIALKNK
ncbi:unnamed protein product [Rotaria magnacalcarata]|uniref:GCF C-terminal domain-containing protein n=1 Tax=Rotaria magnacalcarata TaxID=392030 RepID=A0A8S3H531_9BILA|nr:unnamed protein product [Rotaria magnacalcarata]